MFKNQYTLFELAGIPVKIDLSLLILVGYLILVNGNPFTGLLIAAVLLVSIVAHEFAHSFVAMAYGGKVRDITLQMMGGCAAITKMPVKPYQELIMALAGPVCSLLIALIAYLLLEPLASEKTVLYQGHPVQILQAPMAVIYFCTINVMLGLFNLIPAFPMDGGRVLRAALQMRGQSKVHATWIASRIARGIAIFWACVAVGNIIGIIPEASAAWPVLGQMLWSIAFGGGFILLMIAWMVFKTSEVEYKMAVDEAADHIADPVMPDIVIGDPPYGKNG